MKPFLALMIFIFLSGLLYSQDITNINLKNNKDPRLFYNLGVQFENAGDTGSAILNFKRAGILNPDDTDTKDNLNKLRDSIGVPPYLFDLSPLEKAVLLPFRIFSLNVSFLAGFILFSIGSIGISILFAGLIPPAFSRYLKIIRTSFIVFLCMGVVYIVSSWARYNIDFDKKLCVVTQASNLLDRPSDDAVTISRLPAGMEGSVRRENGSYFLITVIDGHEGWISRSNVIKVWDGIL
jgi:hypothetical protein